MDLLAIADFNLVATHGGFGRASRAAGRSKATLSRRVAELEAELGVRLIERGSHALRLTEAGALLHARTGALLGEVAEVGAIVSAGVDRPRGRLRVSAPVLLSDTVLGRIAADFVRAFPEVELEIKAEDRLADPVDDGYDVVIRINPSPDDRLIGRCVMRDDRWLVAAPSFVRPTASNGNPTPELRAVVRKIPAPGTTWQVRDGQRTACYAPRPVLQLSSIPTLRDAAVAGAGAGLLPRSLVGRDVASGRLVRWGVEDGPQTEIWALHTSRRLVGPKVKAFLQHLAAALADVDAAQASTGDQN